MQDLRFDNLRRPLADWPDGPLGELAREQVEAVLEAYEGWSSIEQAISAEPNLVRKVECVDVIDAKTGKPRFQLYLCGYGGGLLFEGDTARPVALVVQHYLELEDDELLVALARADKLFSGFRGFVAFPDDVKKKARALAKALRDAKS